MPRVCIDEQILNRCELIGYRIPVNISKWLIAAGLPNTPSYRKACIRLFDTHGPTRMLAPPIKNYYAPYYRKNNNEEM